MISRLLTVILVAGMAACGGGGGDSTTPPPATDTTPPITVANPFGGTYGTAPTVTLTANEPASVYYTTDGSEPMVGGASTMSGPSPIANIIIGAGTTVLRFFAVDLAGNRETSIKTATYVVDLVSPTVSLVGPMPGPFGLLTTQSIAWQSDEAGDYVVELGGTGSLGTGTRIAAGAVAANVTVVQPIRGSQLSFTSETPIWIYLTDVVGRTGSTSASLAMKALVSIPDTGGFLSDIEILPGGKKAYVSWLGDVVKVVDIDPSSPTYNTVSESIATGPHPYGLAATPDAMRVYVTNMGQTDLDMDSIGVIDTSSGLLAATIPLGPKVAPGGIGITVDGTRAYFTTFEGGLRILDTAPSSLTYNQVVGSIPIPLLLVGNIAMTPDGKKAVLNWQGLIANAIQVIDVDPLSPTYNTIIGSPVPVVPGSGGDVKVSADSRFAFAGESSGLCWLCKIDLQSFDIIAKIATGSPTGSQYLAITTDGQNLLAGSLNSPKLSVFATSDLTSFGGVDLGGEVEAISVTPDGNRAYVVRTPESQPSDLVMVPLQ